MGRFLSYSLEMRRGGPMGIILYFRTSGLARGAIAGFYLHSQVQS